MGARVLALGVDVKIQFLSHQFLIALLAVTLTTSNLFAADARVDACKARANEAQALCANSAKGSDNVATAFIKLAAMVAMISMGGSTGGMCQMMSQMSQSNANSLQATNAQCTAAANTCTQTCALVTSTPSDELDKSNLESGKATCQAAASQGQETGQDVTKLLEMAMTAAICLKELGMKEEQTVTTTTAPTMNCTDPAQFANPVCICQANPMAKGCGNESKNLASLERTDTGPGTDNTDSPTTTLPPKRSDVPYQKSQSDSPQAAKKGSASRPVGADGGSATSPGLAKDQVPKGIDADVLAGAAGAGGGGSRSSNGGGYPEFTAQQRAALGLRAPAGAQKVAFGILMGQHKNLFKVVHKRYKSVFGGEPTD